MRVGDVRGASEFWSEETCEVLVDTVFCEERAGRHA